VWECRHGNKICNGSNYFSSATCFGPSTILKRQYITRENSLTTGYLSYWVYLYWVKSSFSLYSVGGYSLTINTRLQMVRILLTRSVNTQLALYEAWSGALDVTGRRLIAIAGWLVVEVGWRRCCLEDCWECCSSLELAEWGVLFSEARWSQRMSWSGWFSLKSSPTCSCRWLHCDLQNVPREHAKCTAENVRANRISQCWRLK
jgi:hypothetical protein